MTLDISQVVSPTVPQRAVWLLGITGIVLGAIGTRISVDAGWINFFDNLHWTTTTTATAVLGWLAWQRAVTPSQRDTAFCMAMGVTGYAIGQITWDVQVALGYSAFPAPADALYLTLGPCMTVAMLRLLQRLENSAHRAAALLDSAAISVAVLTLTLVLYLPKRGDTDNLALATLIAYPTAMFAAVATLAVSIPTLRLRITLPLVAFFVGLLGTSLIWMRWNFLALDGLTTAGSWFNLTFSAANLLIGYGLTNWDQSTNKLPKWSRSCEGLLRQFPLLVVVLAAGAVILAHQWRDLPVIVTNVADVGVVIVILLATIRQGTLLREHDELIATQAALRVSEKALATEQAQLKTLVGTIPDLIWLKNPEGVYLGCNKAFENLYGADEKDIIGKTDYDFVPKERADFFRMNDKLAIDTDGDRRNEEELSFSRGGYHGTFETIKTPMRDADGALLGVIGIARDISERKHAQEQMSIQAGILTSLIEGIQVARADTLTIVYVNRQLELLFGYPAGELLGKHVSVLNDPADQSALETVQHILSSLELTGAWKGDVRNVRKDGTPFWSHAAISTFEHPEHGKVWISVHEDATERKVAEQDRRDQHELLQDILKTALDGYWLTDAHGRLLDVNDAACTMLGYTKQEALGLSVSDIDTVDSQEEVESRIQHLRHHGGALFESMHRRKDGSIIDVEVSSRHLPRKDSFSVFVRDITTRKLGEAKLQLAASVFGHAREGIIITNAEGTIVDVNEAFTRITGYGRDEAIGQNPRILKSGRQGKSFYVALWNALSIQGHWSGEVWNRRKDGEVYAQLLTISRVRDGRGATLQYVGLFSDITAIKEHQNQLEHIAHFDTLTNLPNRLLMADRLQQAMAQAQRRGKQLAVAYLDLDGFKNINDRYGHDVGDQLLVHLATAMKDALREGDTLARLGGDEFVAVLIDLDEVVSCVPMLTRLLDSVAIPVTLGDIVLSGSASIGVTFYPQADNVEADQLLRQADQAMYQAKLAGKKRYHIFDAAHDSSVRVHHESLERIRLALESREFVLHYQPKVHMQSGQIIGVEALIRWQHPERGLLAPGTFLPVIEDHALAVEVGEWVIDTALTQIEVWRTAGLDLSVSVNIGARQLQQANFVKRLHEILAQHPNVKPTSLELEVLETSALEDMEQVSQVIEDCHQMGVKFALDDFGTGYSSLTYLKRLRVALLKIDQSFVRDMLDDPDDLAILEGVIGLAAAFKREVIAEGVETVAHGTALLHLGCELAQGYGIARPMPAEQLPTWAATWRPDAAWCTVPTFAETSRHKRD